MSRFFLPTACLFVAALFSLNAIALDKPVVSSNFSDQDKWYKPTVTISFTWSNVEGATKYYYLMDRSPGTDPNPDNPGVESTDTNTAKFKKGIDGTWYFHVRAASGSTLGPTAHFRVNLDGTKPEIGTLSATPTEDGKIKLSWTEATDATSGISHYELYRSPLFDFDLRNYAKKYSPIVGTDYIDLNDMTENITFFYLLVAVDKAGNSSRPSNRASATTLAFCDVNVLFDVSLSDDKNILHVSIDADDDLFGGTLTAKLPDGKLVEFFREAAPFSEFDGNVDLSSVSEGIIVIDLVAREKLGDDCSQSKEFVFDITEPMVEIIYPKLNEKVSEEVKVKVKAFDPGDFNSGIDSIEFFVRTEGWESLGQLLAEEKNVYTIDWNTFNFNNGRYQLKAVARDSVGNTAVDLSGAIVFNTLYQRADANAAINSALESKQSALRFLNSLKKQNVLSQSIEELIAAADSNLLRAKELFGQGGNAFIDSRTFALKAKQLFDSIESAVSFEKVGESVFLYNEEQVPILLNAFPLSQAFASEAEALIRLASPQRKLEIVKVVDGGNVFFRANIVVSFSLPENYLEENDLNFLRLVEFVPKAFSESPSELYSYYSFTVLEEIKQATAIEFKLDSELLGSGSFSYGLNANLSEADANALLEGNVVSKFIVPPLLLRSSPQTPFLWPMLTGLEFSHFIALATVVGVIVLVAVVLFVFVLYRKRKRRGEPNLSVFQ